MSCIQCRKPSNYKCPICREPYCSVDCCKLHREVPCSAPTVINEDIPNKPHEYDFPSDDTVPPEKLELLAKSADLKVCLQNPHVRKILEELDTSPYPDALMQHYMQEPIFTEFVNACLKVVEPDEE